MSYCSDIELLGPEKRNPYKLDRPAAVSFSGGRTSGKMLYEIVSAFGGTLPDDVLIPFANTGKEREETLDFVHEIETRWGVVIRWLEYCRDRSKPTVVWHGKQPRVGCHSFREVTYKTASRNGEPFEQLIEVLADFRREAKDADPLLPNPVQRICTAEMKRRTIERFMKSVGHTCYETAVGLRADEPRRVAGIKATETRDKTYVCPLHKAGVTEADVMAFWAEQEFDLQLQSYEGNCDFCFLKAQWKIMKLAQDHPEKLEWWAQMEDKTGARFRKDRGGYRDIQQGRISLKQCDDDQDVCFCTD